jgi:exonuclease VII large subunit
MNVIKIGLIKIPPSYHEYYKLKSKYKTKCPRCKAFNSLTFSEDNRILKVVCITPRCANNMEIVVPNYITFDQLYNTHKEDYIAITNRILKEKFDLMFEYKKSIDIATLKTNFVQKKQAYEETVTRYEEQLQEKKKHQDELEEQRNELIRLLHTGKSIPELNDIMNQMHQSAYLKINQEMVRRPEFERDIMV